MAMKRGRQGPWPRVSANDQTERGAPMGHFLAMDMVMMTPDMPLAGPLRHGTASHDGVGPKGRSVEAADSRASDMGMDRISPRDSDPCGWPVRQFGQAPSGLLATHIRNDVPAPENDQNAGERARRRRP
jgi:hypothetical protein